MLPEDPVMLLSYINTQLRDVYPSLSELCEDMQVDQEMLVKKLGEIDYAYDPKANRFI